MYFFVFHGFFPQVASFQTRYQQRMQQYCARNFQHEEAAWFSLLAEIRLDAQRKTASGAQNQNQSRARRAYEASQKQLFSDERDSESR